MTPDAAIDLFRQALLLGTLVSAPVLLAGLAAGLAIGILQAATQIQESALSFVPKVAAMAVACAIAGPWMLQRMMAFTSGVIGAVGTVP